MRERIEQAFWHWGHLCARFPWLMISLSVLLTVFMASALPPRIDTTMEGYLRKDSPAIITYDLLREQFGRDEMMITTITTDDIFAPAFIERLQALEQAIWKQVPYADDVVMLTNVRAIYADGDEVRIEGLFENWPGSASLDEITARARNNDLYQRLVLSEDRHSTAVLVRLQNLYRDADSNELASLGEFQFAEAAEGMQAVMAPFIDAGDEVAVAGTPVVTTELQQAMQKDMARFTLLTLLAIGAILWWLFRRPSAVVLPLLVVILAAVSTVGLLAWTDTPLQMPLVIIPSFLIAVGVGDSIHLLTIFFQQLHRQTNIADTLAATLRYTGLAMLLTSLTTAAGLLSFAGSDILPLSSLGWAAAFGVMLAWLYTITLLPGIMALLRRRWRFGEAAVKPRAHHGMNRFTDFCIALSLRYPRRVVAGSAVLALLGLWQASQLQFSHHPLNWLPESWPIRQATQVIDTQLSGSMNIEILLDSGEMDGWRNAERIAALEAFTDEVSRADFAVTPRKIQSLTDMLREMNQALHGGDASAYHAPKDDDLLAQELFLLELSAAQDLYRRVDHDYRTTRITVSVPWVDTLYYADMSEQIQALAANAFDEDIQVSVTGLVPVLARTLAAVIVDTARSYGIAFVVIGAMMMLLLGRVRTGLLAMIPNLLPIIMALGFMRVAGIPLDMFSMLVGAIAIGLAVDDTIHFMHHYQGNRARGASPAQAITDTLHESGRAMLTTSLILAIGFMVFIFSALNNLTGFALVTTVTIIMALLADFILAPALMLLTDRQGKATKAGN